MRILLDTHIWLWSLLEPERLASRVFEALESRENELWLSPVSVWELGMLVAKGRVELDVGVEAWIAEALTRAPLREASLSFEIALETGRVEMPHRDPADRFLVATARVLDLTLATADERLLGLRGVSLLSGRP